MFEINLLRPPGLQAAVAPISKPEPVGTEEAIIGHLRGRIQKTSAPPAPVKHRISFARRLWQLVILVLLGVAAYWASQAWVQYRTAHGRVISITPPTRSAVILPPPASAPSSSAAIMAAFIEQLPSQATIDFMDAGAGVLIYRIWGWELSQYLPQMNAMVEGYRQDDLLAPGGGEAPGYWLGSVTYEAQDTLGILRPAEYGYVGFFDSLQAQINTTGGDIVEMIPGNNATGEYVIRGTLRDIHGHLNTLSAHRPPARYHRMSLLRQSNAPTETYLLRVLFSLGEPESPLLSLQAGFEA